MAVQLIEEETILCGPFVIGTWDAANKVYKNGHHLYVSDDKQFLEVFETDSNGANTNRVCRQSLVSSLSSVGVVIGGSGLVIQGPKTSFTVHTEINASKGMATRLTELPGETSSLTSFIGTDDVRQAFYFFSNHLETLTTSGINFRYDNSASKLIVEY